MTDQFSATNVAFFTAIFILVQSTASIAKTNDTNVLDELALDLVAHYPLDGNGNDVAGSFDGVVVGATPALDRFGSSSGAMYFDGEDDHIATAFAPTYPATSEFTYSIWLSRGDLTGADQAVFSFERRFEGQVSLRVREATSGGLFARLRNDSGGDHPALLSPVIPENNWTHVALVKSANSVSLYVNGQVFDAGFMSSSSINQSNPLELYIGSNNHDPNGTINPYRGSLDDLRIYSRALTIAEIDALRELDGLAAYYPFDLDASDASGQALDPLQESGTTIVEGVLGSAVAFSGNGSQIEIPNPISQEDAFSVATWVRLDEDPMGSPGQFVIFESKDSTQDRFSFWVRRENLTVDGIAGDSANFDLSNDGGVPLEVGEWTHIALVFDRQSGLTSFVNGRLDKRTTGVSGRLNGGRSFVGIRSNQDPQSVSAMSIDDLRLYNRVLATREVRALAESRSVPAPPNNAAGDRLGAAVASANGRVAVGLPGADGGAGQVVIYSVNESELAIEQVIDAPMDFSGSFGGAIDLDGDKLVAGSGSAVNSGKGAMTALQIALLERLDEGWVVTKTMSSDVGGDGFGTSVALDGDLIVAGAPADNSGAGAAYIFSTDDDNAFGKVLPGESAGGFGSSIATQNGVVVVGSPNSFVGNAVAGSFTLIDQISQNLSDFETSAPVVPTDAEANSAFGTSIDLEGAQIVVGAPGALGGSGAVYLFDVMGEDVIEVASTSSVVSAADSGFGSAVAIGGGQILVGAPGVGNGQAFVFDGALSDFSSLLRPSGLSGFGSAVGIDSNGVAIVGAPESVQQTGAATVTVAAATEQIFVNGFEREIEGVRTR